VRFSVNNSIATMSDRESESSGSSGTPQEGPSNAALLESMTLLATLSTAADVHDAIAERRAGRDPSAQEPTPRAEAALKTAGDDLMDLLMQMMFGRVHLEHRAEAESAEVVRHFDLLMKLRRAGRLVHAMHQRLLSLYPDVSEELAEEARQVHDEIQTLVDDGREERVVSDLEPLLERGVSFVVWTRHEV
jgi:hypothetical protein